MTSFVKLHQKKHSTDFLRMEFDLTSETHRPRVVLEIVDFRGVKIDPWIC